MLVFQVLVKEGTFFMGTEYTGGGEGAGAPPDGGLPRKRKAVRWVPALRELLYIQCANTAVNGNTQLKPKILSVQFRR